MLVISDEEELGDLMASDSHNLACILLLRHHAELTEAEIISIAASNTGGMNRSSGLNLRDRTTAGDGGGGGGGGGGGAGHVAPKSTQPIFCEILDTRTQKLIGNHPTLGKSCHFLVSNRLISKVMAMVAEDRKVNHNNTHARLLPCAHTW